MSYFYILMSFETLARSTNVLKTFVNEGRAVMTISSLVVDSYQRNNIASLNLSSETTDHYNP